MAESDERQDVPFIVVRKERVRQDPWLAVHGNNGRKVLVNHMYPTEEEPLQDTEWHLGNDRVPVLETGIGGIEVATFTQTARQDCHKHLVGTEIYTVLEGEMSICLEEDSEVKLEAGDELIVLPGTVHEVLAKGKQFLARLHSINCHGKQDKYVRGRVGWQLDK
jgi:quercetin dioxygenase-like cupin family protein